MVVDIVEANYDKSNAVRMTGFHWFLVAMLIWLLGSFGLSQVFMSNWLFHPTILVEESLLSLPNGYQLVGSLQEANCLEGDCFGVPEQKVSKTVFKSLIPHLEKVYVDVKPKIGPDGVPMSDIFINYLGKEHQGDQKAFLYSEQKGFPGGHVLQSFSRSENGLTIVFQRHIGNILAGTLGIAFLLGILLALVFSEKILGYEIF